MLASAAWMRQRRYWTVAYAAVAVLYCGWPFVAVLFAPIGLDVLRHAIAQAAQDRSVRGLLAFFAHALGLVAALGGVACAVDWHYYGKKTWPVLNILLYNAAGNGDNLYGIEETWYYAKNAVLNLGPVVPIACVLPFIHARGMLGLGGAGGITEKNESGYTMDQLSDALETLGEDRAAVKQLSRRARVALVLQRSHAHCTWKLWPYLVGAWVWWTLLSSRPHKEERFMYPNYPLLCLLAAHACHGALDMITTALAGFQAFPAGQAGSNTKRHLRRFFLVAVAAVAAVCGLGRTVANHVNYRGYVVIAG
jgi:alpha-1,2-mannosyltransferase